jgi:surfeit locus 1 family protein
VSQTSDISRQSSEKRVRSAFIATAIALCILISLGVWQVQRLRWKQGLLAEIDHAEQSPPVPLTGTPPRFTKVWTRGTWLPEIALYGSFVQDAPNGAARLGADRLQLLQRPDGPPVLVDLGWVPTEGTPPPAAAGATTVVGYARAPDHPHWFSPDNDPAAHRFYTLDPAVIGAALQQGNVAPFTLVAMGKPTDTPPMPATTLPRPPNNHLQYALTWFGLAAALVGVFVMWAKEGRSSSPGPR